MIVSFKDVGTRDIFFRDATKDARRTCPQHLWAAASDKLELLDDARFLSDLLVPPGNRLERLKRDRAGQHSIRINSQYRICFCWTDKGPAEVEVVDYH